MDAFHTLAADRLIEASAPNTDLIPFTWAICRLFKAIIPILAIAYLINRGNDRRKISFLPVIGAAVIFGLAAYITIRISGNSDNLPNTMYPEALFTRPWDVAPLITFLIAGTIIYPLYVRNHRNIFSMCLWISVIPDIGAQLHMAFGSTALFDNHFNIAHTLKIFAYLVPFGGLAADYVLANKESLESLDKLQESNEALENEIEVRRRAEDDLSISESKSASILDAVVDGVITIDAATFHSAAVGEGSLGMAFLTGKLQVEGIPVSSLSRFSGLLKPFLSSYRQACAELNGPAK